MEVEAGATTAASGEKLAASPGWDETIGLDHRKHSTCWRPTPWSCYCLISVPQGGRIQGTAPGTSTVVPWDPGVGNVSTHHRHIIHTYIYICDICNMQLHNATNSWSPQSH